MAWRYAQCILHFTWRLLSCYFLACNVNKMGKLVLWRCWTVSEVSNFTPWSVLSFLVPNRMTLTQLFYSTRFLMFSHYNITLSTNDQQNSSWRSSISSFIVLISYWVFLLFLISFSYRYKSSNKLALLLLEISATKSCHSEEKEFQCTTEVPTTEQDCWRVNTMKLWPIKKVVRIFTLFCVHDERWRFGWNWIEFESTTTGVDVCRLPSSTPSTSFIV